MKKHFGLSLLFSVVFASAFIACKTESSDLVDDQALSHCLTVAKDVNTRSQVISRLSFSAQFNYTNNTADLSIVGMVLPKAGSVTGQALPKMSFSNLPWSYNKDGWKVIDVENVSPSILGVSEVPKFKDFEFMVLDVFDGENYMPGIFYDFDVVFGDSDVEVNGCCMTGKTKSEADGVVYCPEEDAAVKEEQRPTYWVDFDFSDSKADIYIYNAKFLGNMPSLNMVFEDVDLSISAGEYVLSSESLIPTCAGVPFPSFPISKLKGTLDFSKGMSLEFHCDFRGTDYTVNFDGKY